MSNKKTTAQFIQDAMAVHGNKYDYSLSNYINCRTKIDIICPEHGLFKQVAGTHLTGSGCSRCEIAKRSKTTEQFIQDAKKKHSNKYDYSLTNYISNGAKVEIICPLHWIFNQTPHNHLHGHGCPQCGAKRKGGRGHPKTTEQFIQDAQKTHGNKYDYSSTSYIKGTMKVEIICPIHGLFKQMPFNHLNGHGCVQCGKKKRKGS